MISLANTAEPLLVIDRSGGRLSHEETSTDFELDVFTNTPAGKLPVRLAGTPLTISRDDCLESSGRWFSGKMAASQNNYLFTSEKELTKDLICPIL
ncbi:MAG: hypothetical protein WDZ51_06975 [Pirellulaceae bacterium]